MLDMFTGTLGNRPTANNFGRQKILRKGARLFEIARNGLAWVMR